MLDLPYDERLERTILGAMLFDEYGCDCGLSCLRSEDFFNLYNQKIYEAIVEIKNNNSLVDAITVSAKLEGQIPQNDILDIACSVVTSANIKSHCNILLELSYRRRSILQAEEIKKIALNNDIEMLNKAVEKLKTDAPGATEVEAVPTILERTLIQLAELKQSGRKISGYPTGLRDLDELISGLEKKKLFIIAGRPAMGKSSLALNIGQYIAKNNKDKNVIFFSLEMTKKELALRLYSSVLDINNEHFKFNMLTADELHTISKQTEKFSSDMENFFIEDDMNVSIYDIQKECRSIRNRTNRETALIIIDYLQIIRIMNAGNRAVDLGEISRTAVSLAKELDCPVILLSQVNRGCEARQDKRPMLSDLKESGNIEQDADCVIFIYRDEVYDSKSVDKDKAELIVAKQRNGATGAIKVRFKKKTTTFRTIY